MNPERLEILPNPSEKILTLSLIDSSPRSAWKLYANDEGRSLTLVVASGHHPDQNSMDSFLQQ
jgi:hypothetical protein